MKQKIQFNILLPFLFVLLTSYGPPNCNLYKANDSCYKACLESEKACYMSQGSVECQNQFDYIVKLCPSFDWAFYEKAVPFAKRGLFHEWKKIFDNALILDPAENLATSGWYHYYFMRNYKMAIRDLEKLDSLVNHDIGYSGDGNYHLNIIKALSYKGIGEEDKAIQIIENHMYNKDYFIGLYDYLHLGVLYLKKGDLKKASSCFETQEKENDISELYFYKALLLEKKGKKELATLAIEKAYTKYIDGYKMNDPYVHCDDQIFLSDIEIVKNRLF